MYFVADGATFVEPWPVHSTTNVLMLLLRIIGVVDVLNGLTISWSTLMELTRLGELGMLAEKKVFCLFSSFAARL